MRKNAAAAKVGGSSGLTKVQRLEKESKEMEMKLMSLKERMSKDTEREIPINGKWQSARTNKGSLSGYSRTVLSKHKERTKSKCFDD